MFYKLAADAVALLHITFVVFTLAGGLLVYRWRWIAVLHIPAVVWGVLLEFRGWTCPLTPLEQQLRSAGNEVSYSGGFVDHYVLPTLYPAEIDRAMQVDMGSILLIINIAVYGWLLWRVRQH